MKYEYAYRLVQEEGEQFLELDAFPEIVCTIEAEEQESGQVADIAYDALKNAMQARIDYDDIIPMSDASRKSEGDNVVRLSPMDTMKVTLYQEYLKRDVSRGAFAQAVEATPTTLSRVFDLEHSSKFEVVNGMFRKLGLSVSTDMAAKRFA